MDVLSLYQPWAQWIAEGFKLIETREHDRYKGLLGKRIGIHAGECYEGSAIFSADRFLSQGDFKDMVTGGTMVSAAKNHGVIICTAVVCQVGWLNRSHSKAAMIDCDSIRRFGLFLKDIIKLETPLKAKGHRGIWKMEVPEK